MHGLRVVDHLAELDREDTPGLNLTYAVRDGIISHCGEEYSRSIIPTNQLKNLEEIKSKDDAKAPCTLEGCVVRMADKIVYLGRDIEDALIAGIIHLEDIPPNVLSVLGENNGAIIGTLLEDLVTEYNADQLILQLSEEKHAALIELKEFNYKNIYFHERVQRVKAQATHALRELFFRLLNDMKMTNRFSSGLENLPEAPVYQVLSDFVKKIRYTKSDCDELIILDFISGMTDNYVIKCMGDIFVPKSIT